MKRSLLLLLLSLFCCPHVWAADTQEEIEKLEAEVLKYFDTKERSMFFKVSNKLKDACEEAGDERLYYKVWVNQGIYEARQQNYTQAFEIAQDIMRDARENGSAYGEYAGIHAEAMILLEKKDYAEAEKAFLKAVDFHRRHYPIESAGEDLVELMEIAAYHLDNQSEVLYARQILNESNVAPMHKGRALLVLLQSSFNNNDVAEFNRFYDELILLKEFECDERLLLFAKVNHAIINGDNTIALRLSDSLPMDVGAERKAHVYHLMGDDANAYRYMLLYKKLNDSLMVVSHNNVVGIYNEQLSNNRMQLEQHQLERENNRLRNKLYLAIGSFLFVILLFFIWKSRKIISTLRADNMQLVYERKDAERALTDLNELSFFESKTELPLTLAFNPNEVCDRIATSTQARCHKGVVVLFQTEMADDFEFKTNADALKQLLIHLLDYSARFTQKGTVKLSCADAGKNIRFVVTDTSAGLGGDSKNHIIGMFSEHDNKIRYVGMNFNICQSITRLLHGRIWHDTEYANGTQFCFELPKEPEGL